MDAVDLGAVPGLVEGRRKLVPLLVTSGHHHPGTTPCLGQELSYREWGWGIGRGCLATAQSSLLLALTVHGSDLLINTGNYLVSALEMQIHFSRPFSFKKRFKYNEY